MSIQILDVTIPSIRKKYLDICISSAEKWLYLYQTISRYMNYDENDFSVAT
jgi:hypothetical protein